MPPLEHPTQQTPGAGAGWNGNDNVAAPPNQYQPPRPAFGAHDQTVQHHLKPAPGHGGIPGAGGGDEFAINSDGGGAKTVGATVPWLQHHSFHAREGGYVSLKESLDNSQEVRERFYCTGVVLRTICRSVSLLPLTSCRRLTHDMAETTWRLNKRTNEHPMSSCTSTSVYALDRVCSRSGQPFYACM